MNVQIVITKDGSTSLYVPGLDEHYHSIHGAVQESLHVFIRNGFLAVPPECKAIRIFEMGFGTGLNVLLTYLNSKWDQHIDYHAIDTVPLDEMIFEQMNYPQVLNDSNSTGVYRKIYQSPWQQKTWIGRQFYLTKDLSRIHDADFSGMFDLVYYDAFSPGVQPECWLPEIFYKIYQHLNPGGILVTYSSKGSLKRTLQQSGFGVEKLPGPPGKKEMIRAIKEK